MKGILLTSSVLILALLLLRRIFRKRISRRLQYALWGLVLLRLLIPANLPAVDFSVLTAAAPVIGTVDEQTLYVRPMSEVVWAPEGTSPLLVVPSGYRFAAMGPPSTDNTRTVTDENRVTRQIEYERQIDLGAVCRPVWYGGMAVMALWLLASNLGFWWKLRRKRIPLELPECRYPVYLVEEGLVSPCLFGLFRPAVYLTPAAMETTDGLRHVLAHEETHGRQKDPLWSLLRSVCLAVYWFDPLVWRAAAASREDCELACDEGALKRLGEDERVPYGQTLLRLIPVRRSAGEILVTATTMTSDKKRLKERITRIAENRKMKTAALCAALAVTAAVCAATFTGYAAAEEPAGAPDVPAAVEPEAPESSTPSDTPVVPEIAALPADAGDISPVLTIPLTGLTPYTPQKADEDVYVEDSHHGEGHHAERYRGRFHEPHMVAGGGTMEPFTDVLGCDGVVVSYTKMLGSNGSEIFNDYYIFEETGHGTEVYLLARAYGEPQLIDLDGDGTCELVSADGWQQAQIFFQRNGELYEANLPELLNEHWKRWDEENWLSGSYDFHSWDPEGRYLYFSTLVPATEGDGISTALVGYRYLHYDGTNLLLYKPERRIVDHVLWTDENLQQPELVQIPARELAKTIYEEFTDGYGMGQDDYGRLLPEWDDYCVTNIEYEYPLEGDQLPNGINLAVYRISYEFHSPTPTRVTLAGGTYVDEDGWVGGFWTETSPYLVFQILEDGSYQLLENDIASDVYAGAPVFFGEITTTLMQNDLLLPSEASGEALFDGMQCSPLNFTSVLSRYPAGEQEAALEKMLAYADSAGEYESGKVRQFANAGYDFSPGEEAVIQRLKDLLAAA